MKLTYQTATATLIQFIALSLLNIGNALDSIISTCIHDSGECVSNMIPSIILYILLVGWYGFIWVLGSSAQERRSKRIAQALICAEAINTLTALFNIKHQSGVLGLITSFIDLALSVWIITLAYRLIRARGGRVVAKQRPRQRHHTTPTE